MVDRHVKVTANPGAVLGTLQRKLQRSKDLLALGITAVDSVATPAEKLQEVLFDIHLAENARSSLDDLKIEYKVWAVEQCFKTYIESLSAFLDEARLICAVYQLSTLGQIRGEDWNRQIQKDGRRFHSKGLPGKLDFLRETYGLIPHLKEETLSVNKARNCLVHRGGVVRQQDTNDGNTLKVKWNKLELFVTSVAGQRTVIALPAVLQVGDTIGMQEVSTSKAFKLRSRVEFEPEESAWIAWTLFRFGQQVIAAVEDYGRKCGVPFRSP